MSGLRVVHYLNQFFGQVGDEEAAGAPPQSRRGALGPGRLLQQILGDEGDVVATVVCGDSRFADDAASATDEIVGLIAEAKPALVVAGPAFNAGRYGQACGQVAAAAQERLGIPAVTGMYGENPGVDLFRDRVLIVETGESARLMTDAMQRIVALGLRLARGETIDRPALEGCFARGMKRSVIRDENAAERTVGMLLAKLRGEPPGTEVSIPRFESVALAPMRKPLAEACVAVVTDGGLVTAGNPEKLPAGFSDRYVRVSVAKLDTLDAQGFGINHGGFDTRFLVADPNRLVPLDALRELERDHVIGKLHDTVHSTAGLGMSVANARKIGAEIAGRLIREGVDVALLTST